MAISNWVFSLALELYSGSSNREKHVNEVGNLLQPKFINLMDRYTHYIYIYIHGHVYRLNDTFEYRDHCAV